MPREVDVRCAEAMGWVRETIPVSALPDPALPKSALTIMVDLGGSDCWIAPDGKIYYFHAGYPFGKEQELPHFSTDPAAALLLENEIERRGLVKAYIFCLYHIGGYENPFVGDNLIIDCTLEVFWEVFRATPEQKARAFLEAINATHTERGAV